MNAMAKGTVRLIRWVVVLCNQVGVLSIFGSLYVLWFSASKLDVYLDWYMKFYMFFVFPAAFANCVNGFVLMVEGRIKGGWPWWRQLAALFGISLPIYGVFHYAKCERALLQPATSSSTRESKT